MKTDIIRVLRVIEYIGQRDWVELTVAKAIHGTQIINSKNRINAATLGAYPEVLEEAARNFIPVEDNLIQKHTSGCAVHYMQVKEVDICNCGLLAGERKDAS